MNKEQVKNDISVSSRLQYITDEKDTKVADFIIDYAFLEIKCHCVYWRTILHNYKLWCRKRDRYFKRKSNSENPESNRSSPPRCAGKNTPTRLTPSAQKSSRSPTTARWWQIRMRGKVSRWRQCFAATLCPPLLLLSPTLPSSSPALLLLCPLRQEPSCL